MNIAFKKRVEQATTPWYEITDINDSLSTILLFSFGRRLRLALRERVNIDRRYIINRASV